MPTPVPRAAKKITFRRLGQPEVEEKEEKQKKSKDITPLEHTILSQTGGRLEVLEAPEKPAPHQEAFEFQAQKMAQVEHLMFQGIRTAHLIAQAVSIPEKVAEKYVKAVLARWQTIGSDVDLKTQRGEAVTYMNFLQNQLWTQFTQAKKIVDDQNRLPTSERNYTAIERASSRMLAINNQIIALNQQRNQLYGLTPQAINQMLIMNGGDDHEVLVRMRKQQGLKELLGKFGALLQQKRVHGRVIDSETGN